MWVQKHRVFSRSTPLRSVGPVTSYKWSYGAPIKAPYKRVTGVTTLLIGVITPFIPGRVGAHLVGMIVFTSVGTS